MSLSQYCHRFRQALQKSEINTSDKCEEPQASETIEVQLPRRKERKKTDDIRWMTAAFPQKGSAWELLSSVNFIATHWFIFTRKVHYWVTLLYHVQTIRYWQSLFIWQNAAAVEQSCLSYGGLFHLNVLLFYSERKSKDVREEEGQRKCILCTFPSERRQVKGSQKIVPIKIIINICYSILLLASVAQLSECLNVWLFRRALSSNDKITSAVKLSHDLTNSFKSNNFMAHMIYSTKVLTSSRPHSVVFFIKQCSMITT